MADEKSEALDTEAESSDRVAEDDFGFDAWFEKDRDAVEDAGRSNENG